MSQSVKRYEYRGQSYTLEQLSALSGVKIKTLGDRLYKGYSIERAVESPKGDTTSPWRNEMNGYLKNTLPRDVSDEYARKLIADIKTRNVSRIVRAKQERT